MPENNPFLFMRMEQPQRSYKPYGDEDDKIYEVEEIKQKNKSDNEISDEESELYKIRDEELLRLWQQMIGVNQAKSNKFLEHIENLSKFIKTLNTNIKYADIETNKIKRRFDFYEIKQKKYLQSNVAFERELQFLQSTISSNYCKQKGIICRLKKENDDLKRQLEEKCHHHCKNNELTGKNRQNLFIDKRFKEMLALQTNDSQLYEEKIAALMTQFESEKKEIAKLYGSQMQHMINDNELKNQELLRLLEDKEKLNTQNQRLLSELRALMESIPESINATKHNTSNNFHSKMDTTIEDGNAIILKNSQLQDGSIAELLGRIRTLQSNVMSIDPNDFLSEKKYLIVPKESRSNNAKVVNESTMFKSEFKCPVYKIPSNKIDNETKNISNTSKNDKTTKPKEMDDKLTMKKESNERIFAQSFSENNINILMKPEQKFVVPPLPLLRKSVEKKTMSSDLERKIHKLKIATYHCINTIKHDL